MWALCGVSMLLVVVATMQTDNSSNVAPMTLAEKMNTLSASTTTQPSAESSKPAADAGGAKDVTTEQDSRTHTFGSDAGGAKDVTTKSSVAADAWSTPKKAPEVSAAAADGWTTPKAEEKKAPEVAKTDAVAPKVVAAVETKPAAEPAAEPAVAAAATAKPVVKQEAVVKKEAVAADKPAEVANVEPAHVRTTTGDHERAAAAVAIKQQALSRLKAKHMLASNVTSTTPATNSTATDSADTTRSDAKSADGATPDSTGADQFTSPVGNLHPTGIMSVFFNEKIMLTAVGIIGCLLVCICAFAQGGDCELK
jgi:hypothetical protein